MIYTVPNQKIIRIKPDESHNTMPYGIITREEEKNAGKLLNDNAAALILYYYFALNQEGYSFALSPNEIEKIYCISYKRYQKAIKKLIEVGYLTQENKHSNVCILTVYRMDAKRLQPMTITLLM